MLQVMPLTAYRQLAQTMTFEMSSENKYKVTWLTYCFLPILGANMTMHSYKIL